MAEQTGKPESISEFSKRCMQLVDRMNNDQLPRDERDKAQIELSRMIRSLSK